MADVAKQNINFSYRPLSFIRDDVEIRKQILNTIICHQIYFEYGKVQKLGSLLSNSQYGYTASAVEEGNCRLLRITDIKESGIYWDGVPFCSCDQVEKYAIQNNDILIARTGGTTGKTVLVKNPPFKTIYASYLIRLSVKDDANPFYVYAFLNSYTFWNQIVEMKQGTAQPNVNAERMKELLIPFCPKVIQDLISNYLMEGKTESEFIKKIDTAFQKVMSKFDKVRLFSVEADQQSTYLTQLRQAILQEAIEGKLTAGWRAQNPVQPGDPETDATALLAQIQAEKARLVVEKKIKPDQPLPTIREEEMPFDLPAGWVWCRLGEITHVFAGYSFNSYDFRKDTGVRCLKITNAGVKEIVETSDYLPPHFIDEYSNFLVKQDDLVIALTRPYISSGLKISRCPNLYHNSLLNQRVAAVRNLFNLNNDYIYFFMTSEHVLNIYKSKFEKTNLQPNLRMSDLTDLAFPFPPLAEQRAIVERVERLLALVDELAAQVAERKVQADALMQAVLREAFQSTPP